MFPVSGAEQLKTSGAHDLAERRVFEVGETGTDFGLRQEQIPQSLLACALLQILDDLGRLPTIALCNLGVEHFLVGIDVLLHERRQTGLELLDFFRVGEFHVQFQAIDDRGRRPPATSVRQAHSAQRQ